MRAGRANTPQPPTSGQTGWTLGEQRLGIAGDDGLEFPVSRAHGCAPAWRRSRVGRCRGRRAWGSSSLAARPPMSVAVMSLRPRANPRRAPSRSRRAGPAGQRPRAPPTSRASAARVEGDEKRTQAAVVATTTKPSSTARSQPSGKSGVALAAAARAGSGGVLEDVHPVAERIEARGDRQVARQPLDRIEGAAEEEHREDHEVHHHREVVQAPGPHRHDHAQAGRGQGGGEHAGGQQRRRPVRRDVAERREQRDQQQRLDHRHRRRAERARDDDPGVVERRAQQQAQHAAIPCRGPATARRAWRRNSAGSWRSGRERGRPGIRRLQQRCRMPPATMVSTPPPITTSPDQRPAPAR